MLPLYGDDVQQRYIKREVRVLFFEAQRRESIVRFEAFKQGVFNEALYEQTGTDNPSYQTELPSRL